MRTKLVEAILAQRYQYTCEDELQRAIASVLSDSSIPHVREYRLTEKDRLDFMVEGIVIEVKVDGSTTAVIRQLHRYAQHPEVKEIVLVTDRARHRSIPREMNGKPVTVAYLNPLSL